MRIQYYCKMENDRERIKKDIMEIIEKDEEGWGGGHLRLNDRIFYGRNSLSLK